MTRPQRVSSHHEVGREPEDWSRERERGEPRPGVLRTSSAGARQSQYARRRAPTPADGQGEQDLRTGSVGAPSGRWRAPSPTSKRARRRIPTSRARPSRSSERGATTAAASSPTGQPASSRPRANAAAQSPLMRAARRHEQVVRAARQPVETVVSALKSGCGVDANAGSRPGECPWASARPQISARSTSRTRAARDRWRWQLPATVPAPAAKPTRAHRPPPPASPVARFTPVLALAAWRRSTCRRVRGGAAGDTRRSRTPSGASRCGRVHRRPPARHERPHDDGCFALRPSRCPRRTGSTPKLLELESPDAPRAHGPARSGDVCARRPACVRGRRTGGHRLLGLLVEGAIAAVELCRRGTRHSERPAVPLLQLPLGAAALVDALGDHDVRAGSAA